MHNLKHEAGRSLTAVGSNGKWILHLLQTSRDGVCIAVTVGGLNEPQMMQPSVHRCQACTSRYCWSVQ